jgi:hypothetical protein
MPQRMRRHLLDNLRQGRRRLYHPLHIHLTHMMPLQNHGRVELPLRRQDTRGQASVPAGCIGQSCRRENILPAPFPIRLLVLPCSANGRYTRPKPAAKSFSCNNFTRSKCLAMAVRNDSGNIVIRSLKPLSLWMAIWLCRNQCLEPATAILRATASPCRKAGGRSIDTPVSPPSKLVAPRPSSIPTVAWACVSAAQSPRSAPASTPRLPGAKTRLHSTPGSGSPPPRLFLKPGTKDMLAPPPRAPRVDAACHEIK